MGESITTYLLENAPWLAALLVVAFVVWKVCRWYSRQEEINRKVETLPCAEHEARHMAIMDKLNTIITYLQTKYPTAVGVFSGKASPRTLNDLGLRLYDEIGGGAFLDKNLDFLIGLIDAKRPKTALDVETSANEVLLESMDLDIFNGLKMWVYNAPSWKVTIGGEERDYSITMNDVCFVISIKLRDAYLERHPELAEIAENDKP